MCWCTACCMPYLQDWYENPICSTPAEADPVNRTPTAPCLLLMSPGQFWLHKRTCCSQREVLCFHVDMGVGYANKLALNVFFLHPIWRTRFWSVLAGVLTLMSQYFPSCQNKSCFLSTNCFHCIFTILHLYTECTDILLQFPLSSTSCCTPCTMYCMRPFFRPRPPLVCLSSFLVPYCPLYLQVFLSPAGSAQGWFQVRPPAASLLPHRALWCWAPSASAASLAPQTLL